MVLSSILLRTGWIQSGRIPLYFLTAFATLGLVILKAEVMNAQTPVLNQRAQTKKGENMEKIVLAVYGVLMLGGGYMGYAKAGSKMSLIMGIVSAIVIFAGLYLTKSNPRAGYGLIARMRDLLSVTFMVRLMKTCSFMPSGMLDIISIIAAVVSVKQLLVK